FGLRKSSQITQTTPNLSDALNILGHHLLVTLKERERFFVARFRTKNETELVDHVRIVGVELQSASGQVFVPISINCEVSFRCLLQKKCAVARLSCERVNQGISIGRVNREHVGTSHRAFRVCRATELGVSVAKKAISGSELPGRRCDALENISRQVRVTS